MNVHTYAAGRYPRRRPPKPQPVATAIVHPAVLAEALRLAAGDPARLLIRNPATVTVLNQPRGPSRH